MTSKPPRSSDAPGWVTRVQLPEPSLQDNTADADRLGAVLKKKFDLDTIDVDLSLCRRLPELLRENRYKLRCLVCRDRRRGVLMHAGPDDAGVVLAGLAVDLGTTRVVMRLVDLDRGRILAETAFDNPQLAIGPDVLARIHHADQPEGLSELNRLIVDGVNRHLMAVCQSCGLRPEHVHLIAVAGNTAMAHLFAGLPVRWMIREPYIPTANRFGLIPAAHLGLAAGPLAQVIIFPNVGSYFGGDLISGMLYSGLPTGSETALLVDVGTNAEVVLGNKDWLMACAGAAGPALEGGMSRIGSTAAPGVIDRVRIDPRSGDFDLRTIDNQLPVGICGSGVIDLAAQLFGAGMIDIRGRFQAARCGPRLRVRDGLAHLLLVPGDQSGTGRDLCISQVDMDSLIRSKAAMYTILETITGTMGMALGDLDIFYVAGTFGSLIDPRSAITIGMLPDLPLERFRSLGNSSLGGATLALTNRNLPEEMDRLRDSVTYLELNVNQDFMNRFSAARFIPHTDGTRFPSVKVPPQVA
jgi:uncharacterized 2Fe-2S/4Fe-4S cluster protein (DUF4445 family)